MENFIPLVSKTKKIEFGRAFVNCLGVVEIHNPEELQISSAYESAKKALPLAAELKVINLKKPLTKEQKSGLSNIRKTIKPLLSHLNSLKKMPDAEKSADVARVFDYVDLHMRGLSRANAYKQFALIGNMLNGIDEQPELKASIQALNLTATFEVIRKDKVALDVIYNERRRALSENQKARTLNIKRTLYFHLRQLSSAIELAQIEHPELDYTPLIKEWNKEVEQCNTSRKKRVASGESEESLETAVGSSESDNMIPVD